MTIAIDASRAINEHAGIGRYTKELVKNLLATDKANRYILIFTYFRSNKEKEKEIATYRGANISIRTAKIPGNLKETLWRGKSQLYNRLYQGADIVLAPSFLEFKNGLNLPQVTIIYDLTTFLFPDQRGKKVSERLSNQALLAIKNSQKVVAISESTKKDIIEFTKIVSNKIKVIYPGLTEFSKVDQSLPKGLAAKKYILFVGTIEPRKNLKGLLIAYGLLPTAIKNKYPLVVAGQIGWNTQGIEKNDQIKYLGRVSDEKLAKLYQEAAVFVYPSLYEGFGFPVIEAMQFGVPVVTSNRSALPESAGNAGVLVNPDESKDIALGLQRVLEGKIDRSKIKKAGLAQAKKFSWAKCVKEVLKVLEESNHV